MVNISVDELVSQIEFAITELHDLFSKIKKNLKFDKNDLASLYTVFQRPDEFNEKEMKKRFVLDFVQGESHEMPDELKHDDTSIFIDKEGNFYRKVVVKNYWVIPGYAFEKIDLNKEAHKIFVTLSRLIEMEVERRKIYYESMAGYVSEEEIDANETEEIEKVISDE